MSGHGVTFGQGKLRAHIVVPQLQQDLSFPDVVALLHGQLRYLSAGGRRQPGALTRFDGSRARIGDAFSHDAALDHRGFEP